MINKSLDIVGKKQADPVAFKASVLNNFSSSTDKGALADCDIVVEVRGSCLIGWRSGYMLCRCCL
jgi:hypothetical protein